MTQQLVPSRRRAGFAVASVAAVVLAGMAGTTSYAAGPGVSSPRASSATAHAGGGRGGQRGFYDARSQAPERTLRTSAESAAQPGVTSSKRALRGRTVLDLDGTTGTVRMLTRLDGFLTGASGKGASHIVHHYLRRHHALLGLTKGDLRTFHLKRNYVDISGTHHLYWMQRIGGRKVISNGLTAAVNKHGRLLALGGSPISKKNLAKLPRGTQRLATPGAALAAARRAGQVPAGADLSQDTATRGLFVTPTGVHLVWRTVALSSHTPAERIVDATTGQLLLQHPLTNYENSHDSTGRVFHFFPKSARGGRQARVDFTKHGWLSRTARVLRGNNSHTFSDVNDDNHSQKSEEVHARVGHSWSYLLKPFHPSLQGAKKFCSNPWPCSWDPDTRRSWKTNRAQNATQVFFFVNNWHDHLKKAPIGFTAAAGNFQAKNGGKHGKGGDAVVSQTDDGANTDHGFPDAAHIDNANMSTPPDGRAPRMQMYLQHAPGTAYSFNGDPFSPTNVGDEADTVYHEYTHGLSNRLDVDVQGFSTLGNVQAGAMGEAWSDWYAMDYLVKKGLQKDRPRKVDVRLFKYDGLGVNFDRTEPIDCAVGSTARLCNGAATGHRGGYTYADYGTVVGSPEVHGDGEIWAQTLWTLRHRLGSKKSEAVVTRAMELAPFNPSFLDMRNAILVADTSLFHGKGRSAIWKVFAKRGMGFFAGSLGGNDSSPGASFATPPKHVTLRTVKGTVTDSNTHAPLKGVPVTLAFQGKGIVNPSAVTDVNGHYAIHGVPQGVYRKLVVNGGGFQPARATIKVGPSGATKNFTVRRDWAAASGGASIESFTGADYTDFGCGPHGAIDLSQATGWGSNVGPGTSDAPTNVFHPKHIVVNLHRAVHVTGFGVDPQSTCGDDPTASTSGYKIETSSDKVSWTTQSTGTFTSADNGRINDVPAATTPSGVRYVKFTIEGNQVPSFATNCPDAPVSGCRFVDLTELEVFGTSP